MATHDYVIANASGAAVRADLNNALAAIVTNNSNATEPATTYPYMLWADTTAGQLKLRNGTNDAWIVLQELDGTMLMEDGTAGAPGLAFANDLDTGLFRAAANQLGIATNGVERVEFGTAETVFNDGGEDIDLRIEGDLEPNLLVVDAGNDRIGIAEAAPGTLVEIGSEAPYVTLKNSTEEDADGGRESRLIFEGEQSGGEISTLAQIEVSHDGAADDEAGKLVISTNDGSNGASPTAALTISSNQTVAVANNLTVNGVQYPDAGPLSNRNLIINGAMNVAQRGTSGTANGFNCIDRFGRDVNLGTGTFTDTQQTLTSGSPYDEGFRKFYRTASSSASSAGSTSYLQVRYKAEAQDIANSGWDYTDSSSFITLSFWVRASVAQTYGFGVQTHDGTSYAYNKNFALSANTWTKIEQRIPGNSNLQFDNDQNNGLTIKFWPHLGSTYNGATDDTWNTQASNNLGSSIGTGWWTASSATFDLTGVQLEVGSKSTPFEHRSYGDELQRCQRYYQKQVILYASPIKSDGTLGLANPRIVEMRAAPTEAGDLSRITGGTFGGTAEQWRVTGTGYNGSATASANNVTADAEL